LLGFKFFIETTELVEERVDEREKFFLKVRDHKGQLLNIEETEGIHEETSKLIFFLSVSQDITG
jgi:hypothetical protein